MFRAYCYGTGTEASATSGAPACSATTTGAAGSASRSPGSAPYGAAATSGGAASTSCNKAAAAKPPTDYAAFSARAAFSAWSPTRDESTGQYESTREYTPAG